MSIFKKVQNRVVTRLDMLIESVGSLRWPDRYLKLYIYFILYSL